MENLFNDLQNQIDGKSSIETLHLFVKMFKDDVVFSSSFGMEDQAITHLLADNDIPINIFTLDTGRNFEETYEVWQRTNKKYNLNIKSYSPNTEDVEKLVTNKGPFSFYNSVEDRKECCKVRKITPLKEALKGKKIWITGLRSEQSEFRQNISRLEYDSHFNIIKFHPILDWSLEQLESFVDENNIPVNSLHKKGYPSIGCAPCTRAVAPGEDFRAGRWSWESSHKECGLHAK